MTIETGLYSRMADDVTLAGLVSTRIWPAQRSQNSALPAVTYRKRDSEAGPHVWQE